MAFLVSPGVQVKETDLTNVVPAASSSIGAIAGPFQWGPVEEIVGISTEKQLVERFGKSTDETFQCFMQAAQFLSYGNALRVVRTVPDGTLNAVSFDAGGTPNTGVLVKNNDHFETVPVSNFNDAWGFARYPGAIGSSLGIAIFSTDMNVDSDWDNWKFSNAFNGPPTEADEMHVVVYDWMGDITGAAGTVLESFGYVSQASDSFGSDGTSNFWRNVVNTGSRWVRVNKGPWQLPNEGSLLSTAAWPVSDVDQDTDYDAIDVYFAGAVDGANEQTHAGLCSAGGTAGTAPVAHTCSVGDEDTDWTDLDSCTLQFEADGVTRATYVSAVAATGNWHDQASCELLSNLDGDAAKFTPATETDQAGGAGWITNGYSMFKDSESVEISLVIQSDEREAVAQYICDNVADYRKDCVAFVSPNIDSTVNNQAPVTGVKEWKDRVGSTSSYAFADSSALFVYDRYNDTHRWIMASGSMAGLAANADSVADPWWSPAGFSRGNIRNVVRLAFNPNQDDRDELYKYGVNPLVSFPGQGTILYGDKTMQMKPSAFDRINVRRLFIVLEKAISTASKYQLFEFNDEFTRAQFRNMVEPFLRDVKGRRGITDFKVVCDETNNTGDIIDTNRFVADIYIKPARSINFITLNFIATRTGVEFSEIAGGN